MRCSPNLSSHPPTPGKMGPKYIVLFTFIVQVWCEQKNSLTFVIDDTASMHDDINQVKRAAKSIIDIVLNEKASQIEDIVVVTFNDPTFQFRHRTRNEVELKQALDRIRVHDGGDCPEMSLSGIRMALEESQPGSYLFVFTDASAKDYRKFDEIKALCQEKQSQIVFVLTGHCGDLSSVYNQVYYKIAAASNGQVFRISKGEVGQVLEYVKETIKGDQTVITSIVVPANKWSTVHFNIDDKTEYALVSASGSKVQLIVRNQYNQEIRGSEVIWTVNVKALKLTGLRPGAYKAMVFGGSDVNVMVFGRTDFNFKFGFSSKIENSLKHTEAQPTQGTETHLIISVKDDEHSVTIQNVEILDMKERVIQVLPLTNVGGNVYSTNKFLPPNTMFKVAVSATARNTGKPIRRIANTPVEPIRPVVVAPEISETEKLLKAKEGETVNIHCRIRKGKPKPQVTWYFKQRGAIGFTLIKDETDEVLRVSNVARGNTGDYRCVATNTAGKADHVVHLEVLGSPAFEKPPSILEVRQSSNVDIYCKISKGNPPPTVTWQFKRSENEKFLNIDNFGEHLKIVNVQMRNSGFYKCQARNAVGTAQHVTQIIILVPPESERGEPSIIRVKENATTTIHCGISKGYPMATLSWWYKNANSDKYVKINKTEEYLRLENVQLSESGNYKCIAQNTVGQADRDMQFIVEAPARIVFVPPNSPFYEGVEGDAVMRLSCTAAGHPKPTVSWLVDQAAVGSEKSGTLYAEDGVLYVKNPKESHSSNYSHTYVCYAENIFGKDKHSYKVIITKYVDYNNPDEKYGEIKKPYHLNCPLSYTDPNSVKWFYNSISFNKTGPALHFNNPTQANNGNYTCRVSDFNGAASYTVELKFGYPPSAARLVHDEEWDGEEDEITCKAEQSPEGKYEWFYRGEKIKEAHAQELELSLIGWGEYVCRVTNQLGSLNITYHVHAEDCIIERSLSKTKNLPVVLDMSSSWPSFERRRQYQIVPKSTKLTMICQDESSKTAIKTQSTTNSFVKFPNTKSVVATCDHEDLCLVDGVAYNFSELVCEQEVPTRVIQTEECLGNGTMMMKVGFNVSGFLEVYKSCMDTKRNVVLYTEVTTTGADSLGYTNEPERSCKNVGDCCYETVQLVSAADVNAGPAEKATWKNPLNTVTYCRPSNENITSWHDIEKQVRKESSRSRLKVWSGAFNYTTVGELLVPQYLWKVVKDLDSDEVLAIIHSNEQTPSASVCESVCDESWLEPYGPRTSCCRHEELELLIQKPFLKLN